MLVVGLSGPILYLFVVGNAEASQASLIVIAAELAVKLSNFVRPVQIIAAWQRTTLQRFDFVYTLLLKGEL